MVKSFTGVFSQVSLGEFVSWGWFMARLLTHPRGFFVTKPSSSCQSLSTVLLFGGLLSTVTLSFSSIKSVFTRSSYIPLNHRQCLPVLCMMYKIHDNCINITLTTYMNVEHVEGQNLRVFVAHLYEFSALRCRTSKFARCFLPQNLYVEWSHLNCVWFYNVEWMEERNVCCYPELVIFSLAQMFVELFWQYSEHIIFPHFGLCY